MRGDGPFLWSKSVSFYKAVYKLVDMELLAERRQPNHHNSSSSSSSSSNNLEDEERLSVFGLLLYINCCDYHYCLCLEEAALTMVQDNHNKNVIQKTLIVSNKNWFSIDGGVPGGWNSCWNISIWFANAIDPDSNKPQRGCFDGGF